MKGCKKYSAEEKQAVIAQIFSEENTELISQISTRLNIPAGTIYSWSAEYQRKNPDAKLHYDKPTKTKGRNLLTKKYSDLRFRVDLETRQEVERRAAFAGKSVSEYCRNRILNHSEKTTLEINQEQLVELRSAINVVAKYRVQLKKIGTNINQAVHQLNRFALGVDDISSLKMQKIYEGDEWIAINYVNQTEQGEEVFSTENLYNRSVELEREINGDSKKCLERLAELIERLT